MALEYSTSCETIVKDLTFILDEIETYANLFNVGNYINIVTYCHLALIDKSNERLLPFVNIINRFHTRESRFKVQCLESYLHKLQSYISK
jgi:hypothetical protein